MSKFLSKFSERLNLGNPTHPHGTYLEISGEESGDYTLKAYKPGPERSDIPDQSVTLTIPQADFWELLSRLPNSRVDK